MSKKIDILTPPERWLTIAEAAAYMRLSQQTVRNFIHEGELRASRLGSIYRLDRQTIDEFMVRRERAIAPYRRGTRPWITEMHARNRKAGGR